MPTPTSSTVPIFSITDVSKTYDMGEVKVNALTNVTLDVEESDLVVILGASGSGKSTLMNILGGLDTPSSGNVWYRGLDITHATDRELTLYRRQAVGYVFQFYNIIPSLTALENVRLVTDIAEDPLDPLEALDIVGLRERRNHFPSQLSGGEQQRVAIARAVAKRPSVLLCDEPTGALDLASGILVLEVIERVHREMGTTVVLITHNASIADMAKHVVKMRSGEVIGIERNEQQRSPHELLW